MVVDPLASTIDSLQSAIMELERKKAELLHQQEVIKKSQSQVIQLIYSLSN